MNENNAKNTITFRRDWRKRRCNRLLIRTRYHPTSYFSYFRAATPIGPRCLIVESSQPHSDTPYLAGLLWASVRPIAETSTWQHTTLKRDMPPAGFETRIPANERPHTLAFDRAAPEIDISLLNIMNSHHFKSCAWSETLSILLYRTTPESWKTWPGYIRIY